MPKYYSHRPNATSDREMRLRQDLLSNRSETGQAWKRLQTSIWHLLMRNEDGNWYLTDIAVPTISVSARFSKLGGKKVLTRRPGIRPFLRSRSRHCYETTNWSDTLHVYASRGTIKARVLLLLAPLAQACSKKEA